MGRKKAIKFASLKMLCDVAVAQESGFQKCPLVREFDTFADCIADHPVSSSTVLLQSGSTGIVTVSVPDCRKSVERSTVPNAETGMQTPPDNLFPDNGKKKFDSASSKLSTVDHCCMDVGEGNFGNEFNETKKIRVSESEGSWNELSKRSRISEKLNLGRPSEESLLKKSLASDHPDLKCKSINQNSLKFMKIKGGEDSNCCVFIDLESEEFEEKRGRESLGVAAYKGEPQKIGISRGGERHDLQPSLNNMGIKKKAKEREVAWNLETENGFLVDFSKVLIGGVDSDGKGVDLLETAKRRGLTFPRPRWWPPEGFEG